MTIPEASSPDARAPRSGGRARVLLRQAVPKPARDALRWADQKLEHSHYVALDRYYGIETFDRVYLDELGVESEGRVFYEAIGWWPLRRALAALHPGPNDVFVDLGSGKGSALVVAGQFPMRRVIGVELADKLNVVARENLTKVRPRLKAGDYEITTADALKWPVPDDLSIVFMFCPFVGDVFSQAMDRIFESYDRNPRPLHLIYAFPWEHNRLLSSGRVEVVDVHAAQWPPKPWWPWSGWVMPTYRVVPAGTEPSPPSKRPLAPLRRQALERWSQPNDQQFALYRPGVGLIEEF